MGDEHALGVADHLQVVEPADLKGGPQVLDRPARAVLLEGGAAPAPAARRAPGRRRAPPRRSPAPAGWPGRPRGRRSRAAGPAPRPRACAAGRPPPSGPRGAASARAGRSWRRSSTRRRSAGCARPALPSRPRRTAGGAASGVRPPARAPRPAATARHRQSARGARWGARGTVRARASRRRAPRRETRRDSPRAPPRTRRRARRSPGRRSTPAGLEGSGQTGAASSSTQRQGADQASAVRAKRAKPSPARTGARPVCGRDGDAAGSSARPRAPPPAPRSIPAGAAGRTNTGPAAVGAAKPHRPAATAADQAGSSTPARATTPRRAQSSEEGAPPRGTNTSRTPRAVRRPYRAAGAPATNSRAWVGARWSAREAGSSSLMASACGRPPSPPGAPHGAASARAGASGAPESGEKRKAPGQGRPSASSRAPIRAASRAWPASPRSSRTDGESPSTTSTRPGGSVRHSWRPRAISRRRRCRAASRPWIPYARRAPWLARRCARCRAAVDPLRRVRPDPRGGSRRSRPAARRSA